MNPISVSFFVQIVSFPADHSHTLQVENRLCLCWYLSKNKSKNEVFGNTQVFIFTLNSKLLFRIFLLLKIKNSATTFFFIKTCAIGKALPRSRRQSDAECTPLYVDSAQCSKYWSGQKPPLLVVSFDGFRYNYINRSFVNEKGVEEPAAPNINRLAQCGVWASSGIVPAFPTVTYPNHWSLVTGLYPASHGIVDNNFYDSELNATFSLTYPTLTNPLWWKGEPVWYTAKRQVCHLSSFRISRTSNKTLYF